MSVDSGSDALAAGGGRPQAPSSSFGTTAVNRISYHGPASSSSSIPKYHHFPVPQEYYASHQPLASPSPSPAPSSHSQPDAEQHQYTLSAPRQELHSDHLGPPASTRPRGKFTEEWDASQRGSSVVESPTPTHAPPHHNMASIHRSRSRSRSVTSARGGDHDGANSAHVSRHNTLKKKASIRRNGSLRRSSSRRSTRAGSVRSLARKSQPATDNDETYSAFYCPVPTTGNPAEVLANRFQSWRKILKDIITYFKEIQSFYDQRSKSLMKLANVLNNVHMPPGFLVSGGLDDAVGVLRHYNSRTILEANKARDIEDDVILALTGLRSDLQLKIKEIKSLSGDFKNTVDKETEQTRRAVRILQDTLGKSEMDSSLTVGKEDPYLLRLAVDRSVERQLDEENYLHQAHLNLEKSGRELESIVVGEIQKSYNAYAGILKREADVAHDAVDDLRVGPVAMPKDHEWASFVQRSDQFVDPNVLIRSAHNIHYPGKNHYLCQEIRAGLLERKSKYLKSYTAGWYVLSPTHLHEFKSADKSQPPVMSLFLPEQRLGSHSTEAGSSPKFVLKGRQTHGVHRAHSWVFRAESFDTMMAWYEDIKVLTEKSPEERNEFVRGHSRTISQSSSRLSLSSDGVVDEDDDEPYSAHHSEAALPNGTSGRQQEAAPRRPSPGGRFPSDIEVSTQRGLQAPHSPSSINGPFPAPGLSEVDQQYQLDGKGIAVAGPMPGSSVARSRSTTENGARPNGDTSMDASGKGTVARKPVPSRTASPVLGQTAPPVLSHPAPPVPSQPPPPVPSQPAPFLNQPVAGSSYAATKPIQKHFSEPAPYANHPATIIVARGRTAQRTNAEEASDDEPFYVATQPTRNQSREPTPYANHPATIVVARGRAAQNTHAVETSDEEPFPGVATKPTRRHISEPAPFANHPATTIVAIGRVGQNTEASGARSEEPRVQARRTARPASADHEAAWLGQRVPIEEAVIPVVGERAPCAFELDDTCAEPVTPRTPTWPLTKEAAGKQTASSSNDATQQAWPLANKAAGEERVAFKNDAVQDRTARLAQRERTRIDSPTLGKLGNEAQTVSVSPESDEQEESDEQDESDELDESDESYESDGHFIPGEYPHGSRHVCRPH